jgi:hypothetical protein
MSPGAPVRTLILPAASTSFRGLWPIGSLGSHFQSPVPGTRLAVVAGPDEHKTFRLLPSAFEALDEFRSRVPLRRAQRMMYTAHFHRTQTMPVGYSKSQMQGMR